MDSNFPEPISDIEVLKEIKVICKLIPKIIFHQQTYNNFLDNYESIIKNDLNIPKNKNVDIKPIINFFK